MHTIVTAVEGGHVTDLTASNAVIRQIVEARNRQRAIDTDEDGEVLGDVEQASDMSASPVPGDIEYRSDPYSEWVPPTRQRALVIGIAGRAGAGKNLAASMIPGAVSVGLADPLYAGISAMFGVSESVLRARSLKERPLPPFGVTVRRLLQTLGTEWGRDSIATDIWIRLLDQRIADLESRGVQVVAVSDVRFANEAEYVRRRGGVVWLVRRPGTEAPADHSSEACGIDADVVIDNAGTAEDLRGQVTAAFLRATQR
jgi:hypothetical protein